MSQAYIDFKAIEEVPNKYNLHPADITKLKVLDWDKIKKICWHNEAMKATGEWWCHLEGCNKPNSRYDDFNEFWIGFNETTGKVKYHFTAEEGMCHYKFTAFYSMKSIENRYDMQVQVNAMRFLNRLLDEKIVELG